MFSREFWRVRNLSVHKASVTSLFSILLLCLLKCPCESIYHVIFHPLSWHHFLSYFPSASLEKFWFTICVLCRIIMIKDSAYCVTQKYIWLVQKLIHIVEDIYLVNASFQKCPDLISVSYTISPFVSLKKYKECGRNLKILWIFSVRKLDKSLLLLCK